MYGTVIMVVYINYSTSIKDNNLAVQKCPTQVHKQYYEVHLSTIYKKRKRSEKSLESGISMSRCKDKKRQKPDRLYLQVF